jgi:hypothetical protein
MKHIKLKLKYFVYIDPKFVVDAETRVAHHFSLIDIRFHIEGSKELVVIDKHKIKEVEGFYKKLFTEFSGAAKTLLENNDKLNIELEHNKDKHDITIQLMEKDNELKLSNEKHKCELLEKDIELIKEKHRCELKDKDIEILELKLKMCNGN